MKKILIALSCALLFSCGKEKKNKFQTSSPSTPVVKKVEKPKNPHTEGERLFKVNCAACHKIDKKFMGPALAGSRDRHSEEWLISFIENSQKMIKSGDEKAVKLYEDNARMVMPKFTQLSKEDIGKILDYVNF